MPYIAFTACLGTVWAFPEAERLAIVELIRILIANAGANYREVVPKLMAKSGFEGWHYDKCLNYLYIAFDLYKQCLANCPNRETAATVYPLFDTMHAFGPYFFTSVLPASLYQEQMRWGIIIAPGAQGAKNVAKNAANNSVDKKLVNSELLLLCKKCAQITEISLRTFTQLCRCVGETANTLGPFFENKARFWPHVTRLMGQSGYPGSKKVNYRAMFSDHVCGDYAIALKYLANNTEAVKVYPYFSVIHDMDLSQSLSKKSYKRVKALRDAADMNSTGISEPVFNKVSDCQSVEPMTAPLNRIPITNTDSVAAPVFQSPTPQLRPKLSQKFAQNVVKEVNAECCTKSVDRDDSVQSRAQISTKGLTVHRKRLCFDNIRANDELFAKQMAQLFAAKTANVGADGQSRHPEPSTTQPIAPTPIPSPLRPGSHPSAPINYLDVGLNEFQNPYVYITTASSPHLAYRTQTVCVGRVWVIAMTFTVDEHRAVVRLMQILRASAGAVDAKVMVNQMAKSGFHDWYYIKCLNCVYNAIDLYKKCLANCPNRETAATVYPLFNTMHSFVPYLRGNAKYANTYVYQELRSLYKVCDQTTEKGLRKFTQLCRCIGDTVRTLGPYVDNCDEFWPHVNELMRNSGYTWFKKYMCRGMFIYHVCNYYRAALKYCAKYTEAVKVYPYFLVIHDMDLSQSLKRKLYYKIRAVRVAKDLYDTNIAVRVVSDVMWAQINRLRQLFEHKCPEPSVKRDKPAIKAIYVESGAPGVCDQSRDTSTTTSSGLWANTWRTEMDQKNMPNIVPNIMPKKVANIAVKPLNVPVLTCPVSDQVPMVETRPDINWWELRGDSDARVTACAVDITVDHYVIDWRLRERDSRRPIGHNQPVSATDWDRELKARALRELRRVSAKITENDFYVFSQLCRSVTATIITWRLDANRDCDHFWPFVSQLMVESDYPTPDGYQCQEVFTEHVCNYYKIALKYCANYTEADSVYPYFSVIHDMHLSHSLSNKSYSKIKALRDVFTH